MRTLALGPDNGDLTLMTDSAGRGKRLGHRLTLAAQEWSVRVHFENGQPTLGDLCVTTESLKVVASGGGVTPLSALDKAAIHRNLQSTLHAKDHAEIAYTARSIRATDEGYELEGPLRIAGTSHPFSVAVTVDEEAGDYHLAATCSLRQTDFGIRPYSAVLGTIKVADEVVVAWQVVVPGAEVSNAQSE